jgi:5'-phosphate synthase pdxT subunit
MKKVGILALQGAFIEHEKMLEQLGVSCIELRNKEDLEKPYDGIILPGGESTVQGKLLKELDMFDTIKKQIEEGMPVLATCAGLILLAKDIKDQEETYFGTIPMTFIRAPYVESVEEGVKVLAEVDGNIVGVEYGNQIGVAFHPELDENLRVHEKFISRL